MTNDSLITNKIILNFKTGIPKIVQCVTNANNRSNTFVNSEKQV